MANGNTLTVDPSDVTLAGSLLTADPSEVQPFEPAAPLRPEVQRAVTGIPRPRTSVETQPLISLPTLLPKAERTGTQYAAAPNQPTPQERLGEMVPQAAVPALAAAKKYAVDPFEKAAAAGARTGSNIVEGTVARIIQPFAAPELAARPTVPIEEMRQRFPVSLGVARGAGEIAGSTVSDPRNWPFFASSAARPILQKLMPRIRNQSRLTGNRRSEGATSKLG